MAFRYQQTSREAEEEMYQAEIDAAIAAEEAESERQTAAASSRKRQTNGTSKQVKNVPKGKGKAKEQVVEILSGSCDSDVEFEQVATGQLRVHPDIRKLDEELLSLDVQINELMDLRERVAAERNQRLKELSSLPRPAPVKQKKIAQAVKGHSSQAVDYFDSSAFPWSGKLKTTLDRYFGIKKLRLCQEGVLNAVMDGRDAICIMPTGGGKSICFQAPAILSEGTTLVISPLLSLMADQVMHLTEQGVEAVMITGTTSREEVKTITDRLKSQGDGEHKPIKLCYVTPEKMIKAKTFQNVLSVMFEKGLLARIAIDESHCCSSMGHDFRPDYKKLSMLKRMFPGTPIIALTATCGKAVLTDVVDILQLEACSPGEAALPGKTAFFSAPLYRSNLHYSIRSKPQNASAVIKEMVQEIESRHLNETGIIYCFTKKETEAVAEGIIKESQGRIKCGTYHAGMSDGHKQSIHERWRSGKVKCVIATTAFGLGIDAPNVRYVFHHSMSKSMEGYYQETGRAGRDGQTSSCILWFRPADVVRLSTLVMGESTGLDKLYTMAKFALDLLTCRKLLFDDYFGDPASVVAPFTASDRAVCGHCDNCFRSDRNAGDQDGADASTKASVDSTTTVHTRDAGLDAWKICKVVVGTAQQKGKVTLAAVCDLVRGLGKGSFNTSMKDKNQGTANINLQELCRGKLDLSKDDTEALVLHLIMRGYLAEHFVSTAYTVNSYIVPTNDAVRFTRLRYEQATTSGVTFEVSSLVKKGKGIKRKTGDGESDDNGDEDVPPRKRGAKKTAADLTGLPDTPGGARPKEKRRLTPAKGMTESLSEQELLDSWKAKKGGTISASTSSSRTTSVNTPTIDDPEEIIDEADVDLYGDEDEPLNAVSSKTGGVRSNSQRSPDDGSDLDDDTSSDAWVVQPWQEHRHTPAKAAQAGQSTSKKQTNSVPDGQGVERARGKGRMVVIDSE